MAGGWRYYKEDNQWHYIEGLCTGEPDETEIDFYCHAGYVKYGKAIFERFCHWHVCPHCGLYQARWIRQGWCICTHCERVTTFESINEYEWFCNVEQREPEEDEFESMLKGRHEN